MSSTAAAALAKKRVRRQKQFLAVGTVALLGILGYQLPKLLGGGEKSAAPAVTAPATSSTAAAAAPSTPAPITGKLRDTDGLTVERDTSQLLAFGMFKSKDPFVQQLATVDAPASVPAARPAAPVQKKTQKQTNATQAPQAPQAPAAPASTASTVPAVVTTPVTTTPTVPPTTQVLTPTAVPSTAVPTGAPPSTPTTVLISTNGVCEQVPLNGTFPTNEDLFRVVEVAKTGKWVKIAIVGGSYDSGQATATARLGEKLTLVNTSDGSQYVIVLQAKCTPAPSAATVAPTPPVTTPAPALVPAPVPVPPPAVPPIITDASDTPPAPSN